jgi:hypothetical protein
VNAPLSSPNQPRARRALAKGQVWLSWQDRLSPAGELLDLSQKGIRYRQDPLSLGVDGFPVPAPEINQAVLAAITFRSGESPRPLAAQAVRVIIGRDGTVEVALRFETQDAENWKIMHRNYVAASLQSAQRRLASFRARVFNEPTTGQPKKDRLGRILVQRRSLQRKELDAFVAGNRKGVRLGDGLVKSGLVSNRQLAEALAQHLGMPFVDLTTVEIEGAARKLLPEEKQKELKVVPFGTEKGRLLVAAGEPLGAWEERELSQLVGRPVRVYLAAADQVAEALQTEFKPPKARRFPRIKAGVAVRYRFYGSAWQVLDRRIFEGLAADVSSGGVLISGPTPGELVTAFQKGSAPRVHLAAQLMQPSMSAPAVVRLEPVRLTPLAQTAGFEWISGMLDAPACWIGARVNAQLPEDAKTLATFYMNLLKKGS